MARSDLTVIQERRLRQSLIEQTERNERLIKALREARDHLTKAIKAAYKVKENADA